MMLLTRVGFDRRLNRTRDVLALFALGALAPTTIAATIGSLGLAIGGSLAWSSFWSNWHLWWLGDATGVMVIAPLALVFIPDGWSWVRGLRWPGWWKALEVAAWLAALVTIVLVAVGLPLQFATLIFPTLAWGALRFGKRGATLAIAVTRDRHGARPQARPQHPVGRIDRQRAAVRPDRFCSSSARRRSCWRR